MFSTAGDEQAVLCSCGVSCRHVLHDARWNPTFKQKNVIDHLIGLGRWRPRFLDICWDTREECSRNPGKNTLNGWRGFETGFQQVTQILWWIAATVACIYIVRNKLQMSYCWNVSLSLAFNIVTIELQSLFSLWNGFIGYLKKY